MNDSVLARSRRRRLLLAATVGASVVALASTAWACTLRIGRLEVCNPAVQLCSAVTGSGAQVGLAVVDDNGSTVTISGRQFLANVPYTVTWRHPGSTGNCHRVNPDGSIVSLIGTTNGRPNTVLGPNFDRVGTTPSTAGRTVRTGLARICVQDTNIETQDQSVVTGNVLDVTVAVL